MKKTILTLAKALLVVALLVTTQATPVSAQGPQSWESYGIGCTQTATGDDGQAYEVATIQGFGCLLANVFSVAITVIGLAAFAMLLYGAFRYQLSGGNSKGVEDARKTITFALIGVVVALSAFIILNLIAQFTGVDEVTEFQIPTSDTNFN